MNIKEVADWFWIAENDIETAKWLNKNKKLENSTVYYHCSQAVEKYLKGFLVYNDKKYEKDHNLSVAVKKCADCDTAFNDVEFECNKMSALIKNIRYPGRIMPTKEDITLAFELIKKIQNLKPIQALYTAIADKHGNNWRKDLFGENDNIS
jgi:HEPN domain-containing protein